MLEDIWNSILDLTSKLVIPDWGALVALIPVGLLILVATWLILTVRRFATAGPTRRGRQRIAPAPPPDVHVPAGTYAPILVAIGAALLFFGLVVGGTALWIGLAALVVTMLVWGRLGLQDYDHLGGEAVARLPAPVHAGPPPGVHMPAPSFRPILGAFGVAVLFFGLVFGGWLLLVGVMLTIVTLIGWLIDARKEYVKTVQADSSGHLEALPDPSWPRRLLWVGAALVIVALLVDNGIVPPRSDTDTAAGGGPGASPAPGGGGGGGGAPPPASPPAGPSLPPGDAVIVAEGIAFTTTEVTVPGPDFTIVFDHRDSGAPHDVDITNGSKLFDGEIVTGPTVIVYDVTGVQPGSYRFICSVHSNMTGTITVQ